MPESGPPTTWRPSGSRASAASRVACVITWLRFLQLDRGRSDRTRRCSPGVFLFVILNAERREGRYLGRPLECTVEQMLIVDQFAHQAPVEKGLVGRDVPTGQHPVGGGH